MESPFVHNRSLPRQQRSPYLVALLAAGEPSSSWTSTAAPYRSHNQDVETHPQQHRRDGPEAGAGNQGRPARKAEPCPTRHRPSLDKCLTIEDLSAGDTAAELLPEGSRSIIGHVGRCCLDCGERLSGAIGESPSVPCEQGEQDGGGQSNNCDNSEPAKREHAFSRSVRAACRAVREVENRRRRIRMLLSLVEWMRSKAGPD